jgi:hypothetical protein
MSEEQISNHHGAALDQNPPSSNFNSNLFMDTSLVLDDSELLSVGTGPRIPSVSY